MSGEEPSAQVEEEMPLNILRKKKIRGEINEEI